MRLLEHEAKDILKKYKIPLPQGQVVTPGQKVDFPTPCVLKAQVPMGGRGKAGGVLMVEAGQEIGPVAEELFASTIRDYTPLRLLVEERVEIAQEFFLAVTYDTLAKLPVAIFTRHGGVDVEELSRQRPGEVQKAHFKVQDRFPSFRAREIIAQAGVSGKLLLQLGAVFSRLADVFLDQDAILVEINPLVATRAGGLVALDCHLEIDDDALARHPGLTGLEKDDQRIAGGRSASEFERRAQEIDSLDHRGVAGRMIEFPGDLGLIIGGGGASLTTFDAVRQHGGQPANYCEIGGNPSVRKVAELTRHILSKPGVRQVAVIMNVVSNTRVDLVARGVVKGILAAGKEPAETLAVFRVPGAWEEEGFRILDKYGVTYCDRTVSIDQAAKIAVSNAVGL